MRQAFILWMMLCRVGITVGAPQEATEETIREVLEQRSLTERSDMSGDEEDGLSLDHIIRFRLPINSVDPERLAQLPGLTPLQVRQFEQYRSLRGPFIDLMELQAIPTWDPVTVRRLLPLLKLSETVRTMPELSERARKGEHMLLWRMGFSGLTSTSGDSEPFDSPLRLLLRYNYRFRNLLQWGATMEKDPGEAVWRRPGFGPDFFSGHLALRDLRVIKALVLGDFQVSLGQGLIHWQGVSFGMGSDALGVLRQGPVLKPYNGTDENRFHRGVGMHLQRGRWDGFMFQGRDRKDANLAVDSSVGSGLVARSLQTSGLHRTAAELEYRDALPVGTLGAGIRYRRSAFHMGWQGLWHRFGHALSPAPEPYRLYALRGNGWMNQSVSHGFTWRNMHIFGEAAMDARGRTAFVQGALASLHGDLDLALLWRRIDPGYRAWQADAHTAQTEPMNETGLYAGVLLRPAPGLRVDGWLDISRFPRLKYRMDVPSGQLSHLVSIVWTPDKSTRMQLRWQGEVSEQHATLPALGMRDILATHRTALRWHLEHSLARDLQIRMRADACRVQALGLPVRGYLFFTDLVHKPVMSAWRFIGRFAWYEADAYTARLYAYEHDVPFQQSLASVHGKGARFYLLTQFKPNRHWQVALKAGASHERDLGAWSVDARLQLIYRTGVSHTGSD